MDSYWGCYLSLTGTLISPCSTLHIAMNIWLQRISLNRWVTQTSLVSLWVVPHTIHVHTLLTTPYVYFYLGGNCVWWEWYKERTEWHLSIRWVWLQSKSYMYCVKAYMYICTQLRIKQVIVWCWSCSMYKTLTVHSLRTMTCGRGNQSGKVSYYTTSIVTLFHYLWHCLCPALPQVVPMSLGIMGRNVSVLGMCPYIQCAVCNGWSKRASSRSTCSSSSSSTS